MNISISPMCTNLHEDTFQFEYPCEKQSCELKLGLGVFNLENIDLLKVKTTNTRKKGLK